MAKPITPDDASLARAKAIPALVIEAFNELIAKNWDGRSATIKQDDVVSLVVEKALAAELLEGDHMPMLREEMFKNRWLDVEETYRAAGWKVEYDKPAYCETYEATFKFEKRR